MSSLDAAERVAELADAVNKYTEYAEFRDRVEVLEAHLEHAIVRNEQLDAANALLKAEAMRINNNAAFYELILDRVKENESLQPLWDEFLVALKLVCPDIEDQFRNINNGMQWK